MLDQYLEVSSDVQRNCASAVHVPAECTLVIPCKCRHLLGTDAEQIKRNDHWVSAFVEAYRERRN